MFSSHHHFLILHYMNDYVGYNKNSNNWYFFPLYNISLATVTVPQFMHQLCNLLRTQWIKTMH